jgi:hypothetical protein
VVTHKIHRRLFESVIPGVLQSYDLPDLVTALAPRPVWIVNSLDTLGNPIPQKEYSGVYAGALGAYQMMRAAQALQLKQTNPGESFGNYIELLR